MVTRKKNTFTLTEQTVFYTKMLHWMNQCNIFCLLQTSNNNNDYSTYDYIAGIEAVEQITANTNCLTTLSSLDAKKDWLFGNINYTLKNEIENLTSKNDSNIAFDTVSFFVPKIVLQVKQNILTIESVETDNAALFKTILDTEISESKVSTNVSIQHTVNREEYIETIEHLKQHIQRGDCYEINYCMEFFANNATINPLTIFSKLNALSPNPFTAFYKNNSQYLLCASPERFLKKEGNTLISQPIKGTIKRNTQDKTSDNALKVALQNSQKEISENVMVVDLVRNDLSKICMANSVKVANLLQVVSFPQVHHLISTIVGELKSNTSFAEIIAATFPMGSMTGAPKKSVLQLIEKYETCNRGIFSGTLGYIQPNGDFDFNVVIRSIMYNATTKYLNYMVGSGITTYCDAANEYEECLLKAKAIATVLQQ